LLNKAGTKTLGKFKSKTAAMKREKQIQFFKREKK